MVRINKQHINRFKYFGRAYNYNLSPGLWLSFDKDTLEYIGVECFYLADINKLEVAAENKINELLSKDLLELL